MKEFAGGTGGYCPDDHTRAQRHEGVFVVIREYDAAHGVWAMSGRYLDGRFFSCREGQDLGRLESGERGWVEGHGQGIGNRGGICGHGWK